MRVVRGGHFWQLGSIASLAVETSSILIDPNMAGILELDLKNIHVYTWDKYKYPIPRVTHGTSISQTYIRQCLPLCEGQV